RLRGHGTQPRHLARNEEDTTTRKELCSMSIDNTLKDLFTLLDERKAVLDELDRYYAGMQPLTFLSPEAAAAVGTRFGRVGTNIPRLAVNSLNERLRVTGFRRDGDPDPSLWQ